MFKKRYILVEIDHQSFARIHSLPPPDCPSVSCCCPCDDATASASPPWLRDALLSPFFSLFSPSLVPATLTGRLDVADGGTAASTMLDCGSSAAVRAGATSAALGPPSATALASLRK